MKRIFFVRHGQAEGNIGPIRQSSDAPLTKKGMEQAKIITERLSNLDFELLISSPITRAHQAAEIISQKTDKEITISVCLLKEKGLANS